MNLVKRLLKAIFILPPLSSAKRIAAGGEGKAGMTSRTMRRIWQNVSNSIINMHRGVCVWGIWRKETPHTKKSPTVAQWSFQVNSQISMTTTYLQTFKCHAVQALCIRVFQAQITQTYSSIKHKMYFCATILCANVQQDLCKYVLKFLERLRDILSCSIKILECLCSPNMRLEERYIERNTTYGHWTRHSTYYQWV